MGRRNLNIDKNDLYNLYINNKLSMTKIAKLYDTSAFTIRNYCIRYSIPTRSFSEAACLLNYSGKNNPFYGKKHTNEIKARLRFINTGKKLSDEIKNKISLKSREFRHSKETKEKISKANRGIKHPNYIDGRTTLYSSIRAISVFKIWRTSVFIRDSRICNSCGYIGKGIEAHHKKRFSEILSEFLKEYDQFSPIEDKETLVRLAIKYKPFWDINNGKTLCENCHKFKKVRRNKWIIEI